MRVFGGVRLDVEAARQKSLRDLYLAYPGWRPPFGLELLSWTLCAFDMPLSAVGDTLTLPFTIFASLNKPVDDAEKTPIPIPDGNTWRQDGHLTFDHIKGDSE